MYDVIVDSFTKEGRAAPCHKEYIPGKTMKTLGLSKALRLVLFFIVVGILQACPSKMVFFQKNERAFVSFNIVFKIYFLFE